MSVDKLIAELPEQFWTVRYDGRRTPDGSHDLSKGANCQRYAYAVLAHFGFFLPPFRSSQLWADNRFSPVVGESGPLDLLLFSRTGDAWGAHIGVYLSSHQVLHLAKAEGTPKVWALADFSRHERYRILVGSKQVFPSKSL